MRSVGTGNTRRFASAFTLVFTGPGAARSYATALGLGTLLTGFYLIALPAGSFGALRPGALHFLTPPLAVSAALLGYGFALTLTLNINARPGNAGAPRRSGLLGLGGLFASLLPSSLCCTPVIPLVLAAIGVSAPAIFRTSGKFQAFFAIHADAFIAGSVILVLLSVWFAAYNLTTPCAVGAAKDSPT
ncbi:hypothetical protein EPN52_12510 [bacterium]|nr:MAG: hypothetical protein EPN52_12510 [bacterium]